MSIYRDAIGSVIDDRYYIEHYLGEGGFGVVFRAEQRIFNVSFRRVALKVFKEDKVTLESARKTFSDAILLARILDENRAQEGVRFLTHVYDIGLLRDLDNRGYVAMELVNGGDLHDKIKSLRAPLPAVDAVDIMRQICMGMCVLHGYLSPEGEMRPIVHRDLKPGNILLDRNGNVKIADFGLAAELDRVLGSTANAGTIHCQAPESFDRFSNDTRSDVYSLGLIFYEMVTQKQPFEHIDMAFTDQDRSEYIRAQVKARKWFDQEKKPPSALNIGLRRENRLDEIVMKCLSYYPGERYKDAAELLKAIEELTSEKGTVETPLSMDEEIDLLIDKAFFFMDQEQDYDQAFTLLKAAHQITTSHNRKAPLPKLHFALGKCHFGMKNFTEAVKNYNEGLKLKPLGRYFHELADVYRAVNQPALAKRQEEQGRKHPWE